MCKSTILFTTQFSVRKNYDFFKHNKTVNCTQGAFNLCKKNNFKQALNFTVNWAILIVNTNNYKKITKNTNLNILLTNVSTEYSIWKIYFIFKKKSQ